MDIELLVVQDCANEAAAADLIATAVADTRVQATVTRTIITSLDQAQHRGFVGSPTILLNGTDRFARSDAPVSLCCRLYPTPDGLRGVPALPELREALKQVTTD